MAYVEKNTPSSPNPGTINVTLFIHCLMYEKTHNIGCSFYINDLRILNIFNFLGSVVVRGRYYKGNYPFEGYFQHVQFTINNIQQIAMKSNYVFFFLLFISKFIVMESTCLAYPKCLTFINNHLPLCQPQGWVLFLGNNHSFMRVNRIIQTNPIILKKRKTHRTSS